MITIGKPVEIPKDKYIFELSAMHGDADDFTDVEYIAIDEADAERVCEGLLPLRRSRDKDKIRSLFLEDLENEDIDYESIWPVDNPEYNSGLGASLWKWELYYYDPQGIKYHTNKKG